MSQLFVQVASPGSGAVVPRSFVVTGSITVQLTLGRGPVTGRSASVQFGDGGPAFAATFTTATAWTCTGQIAAGVPPNSLINVRVTANASIRYMHTPSEPDIETVTASTVVTVRIANPPPVVSIDAIPADVTATQLPFAFTLAGSVSDPDANVTSVLCALDTDGFETAE